MLKCNHVVRSKSRGLPWPKRKPPRIELQRTTGWKGKEQVPPRSQCRDAPSLGADYRDHENFLTLLRDLRLDVDHSVSDLLTHLSPQLRAEHCSKQPLRHTTGTAGKQGREIIPEIPIKFLPLQCHLRRHRTARTDISSRAWLHNLSPFLDPSLKPHEWRQQDAASTEE